MGHFTQNWSLTYFIKSIQNTDWNPWYCVPSRKSHWVSYITSYTRGQALPQMGLLASLTLIGVSWMKISLYLTVQSTLYCFLYYIVKLNSIANFNVTSFLSDTNHLILIIWYNWSDTVTFQMALSLQYQAVIHYRGCPSTYPWYTEPYFYPKSDAL